MGSVIKFFGLFVALCLGFVLVISTIIGVSILLLDAGDLEHIFPAPVVFTGVTLAFLFVVLLTAVVYRIITPAPRKRKGDEPTSVEETRVMQELYRGFERMEDRVEALEEILLSQNHSPVEKSGTSRRGSLRGSRNL